MEVLILGAIMFVQCFCLYMGGVGRVKRLTCRKYFDQRLSDVDGRFARDLDYLFVAQYIVDAKQVMAITLLGVKSL